MDDNSITDLIKSLNNLELDDSIALEEKNLIESENNNDIIIETITDINNDTDNFEKSVDAQDNNEKSENENDGINQYEICDLYSRILEDERFINLKEIITEMKLKKINYKRNFMDDDDDLDLDMLIDNINKKKIIIQKNNSL